MAMEVKLQVNDVCLSASGGSYIARYHATLAITDGAGETMIEVASTVPKDPDPTLLQATIEHIASGVDSVLQPRNQSAVMTIRDLVIHDVDCKPPRYKSATVSELTRLLS